uniref:BTB domain-containing protein n=1 Tax=Esox lucius TaxID=8010 RepID=A0A6Q2XZI7_ESOLU
MSVVLATPDCTPKCRSVRHADEVVAALTRGSEGCLRAFLTAHCHNAAKLRDAFGRTALHLAASLGKKALLDWLLESKSADLMVKDKESGWTALHRSVFYGHIHCLMSLVKHGGNLFTQDKEGLSVLDLTMKDRPAHVVFTKTDPTEVYTWGNNANFSLGHGNQESRHHPEIVDVFARTGVYIKQVVLCKFHSVFLSQKGQVYTCGHGQGGRLGHGDEQTYLVPRMVEGLMSHHCSQVSAAKDHTVVLTEEGYVYTFGLNTYHQLGLAPPPASSHLPKQVFSKTLKGRTVIGVAAGRFHTVLWTREAVYSMGLNGGQLGYLLDPNGEKCVTTPRQVSALHHKDISIAMVAASNGATVVVTEKGDVYLLADYQCKKLVSRQLNIRKVLVSGGSLDHRVDPQVLNEGGGEKVAILALDEAGRVFCWRSVGGSVRQCRWAYGRQVFMSDIALSRNTMMFVTQEGEGFSGQWHGEYRRNGSAEVCGHPEAGTVYERIRLEKLPYVHRASDPKTGYYFETDNLYEIPIVSSSSFSQHFRSLLEEADETDGIHDVTLQAGHCTFPAHKYLLSMRSEFFRKQLAVGGAEQGVRDGEVTRSEDASGCDLLVLEKVSYEMLEHVLKFIYTDTCELLIQGHRPRVSGQKENQQDPEQLISNLQDLGLEGGLRGHSALEVYRSLPTSALRDGKKPKNKGAKSGKKAKVGKAGPREGGGGVDPVKALQGVAKKLGISSLSARLDGVKYENGKINVVHKKTGNKLRFNQNKCSYLCDVTLRSDDGKEFPCHKCVLCARLEYFHSMLGNPWFEATSCSALEMPTSSEILQVILEYVYTDESPTVKECVNVEFVCNVLVVADQLLITRLKEMCEVALTENLTLKNAAELLEFAAMYNAEQLKVSCLQFIVLNMAALLESKWVSVFVLFLTQNPHWAGSYRLLVTLLYYDWCCAPVLYPALVLCTGLEKWGKSTSMESLQELLTSDSEGSYMGAGSPRDLPSPIFPDRPEDERAGGGAKTKTPPGTPTTARNGPARPLPVMDLRAIMDMEASSKTQSLGATPKSPGVAVGGSGGKQSPLPAKLSQKQRKMIAMASKEGSGEGACLKSHPSITPSKSAKTPLSFRSFRDLLVEEETRVRSGGPGSSGGQGTLVPNVSAARRVTFKSPAEPPTVGSPPMASMVTFASIVEEAKQQEAALIRSREKPLALIQIEEAAIQELLLHYGARSNPDELIVVERSALGPIATPFWNKH